MDDALIRLMHAAELADNLSASRRKRIALVIRAEGIVIEGRYFSASGLITEDHSLTIGWPTILDSENALTEAIKLMDEQLTERWRKDGE